MIIDPRCVRCKQPYSAGHVCLGPRGTPHERGIARLRLGEPLRNDERDALLRALGEKP